MTTAPPGPRQGEAALVRVYSTLICPYCIRAKLLLKSRGIAFEEIDVTGNSAARQWLVKTTGRRSVPQIFIRDEAIGGFAELRALDRSGDLANRLSAVGPSSG